MDNETVADVVRRMESDYNSGTTKISDYVEVSLRKDVNKIDAYANSKHVSGEFDALGRRKPFFNVVTAAMNIWYRATDIDRANIKIRATKSSDHILAKIYNILLHEWMKVARFGVFLNEWGRTLAKYGGALVKFVEKDGELIASVVPWNRVIVDPVNVEANPIIEKLYLTPSQLRQNKSYNKDVVKELLDTRTARKTLGRQNKDTKADYVELYEVHGEFSLAQYKQAKGQKVNEGDEDVFFQQMHVLSYVVKTGRSKEFDNFTVYCGREDNPYMMTNLIKEDGYILGMGAVKSLFEAQWMVNHNEKNIKDQLDLASKIVFQTADETFAGRNALMDIETGDVLVSKLNMPLTALNNQAHDIGAMQSDQTQWKNQGMEATGTPDAIRGNTMPSGTPAILAEQLAQQSMSLFEIMIENKGMDLEYMISHFVLPFFDKRLGNADEVTATLSNEGIKEIDDIYIPHEAIRRHNQAFKDAVLRREIPSPFNRDLAEMSVREELQKQGESRSFVPSDIPGMTWKKLFKDFRKRVEVEITNEMSNKATVLSDLNTTLSNLIRLGDVENSRLVLGKILEEMDVVSPLELSQIKNAPQPLPGGSNGGGGLQEV